jgi:hypothetical protein
MITNGETLDRFGTPRMQGGKRQQLKRKQGCAEAGMRAVAETLQQGRAEPTTHLMKEPNCHNPFVYRVWTGTGGKNASANIKTRAEDWI